MCIPCMKNIDSRSNYLLLKTLDPIVINDTYTESDDNDTSPEHASREFINSYERECLKPAGGATYENVGLVVRIAMLVMLLLICIGNQIESNSMKQELDMLRTEMKETTRNANVQRRRTERMRRLFDNADEAVMHVLKSYEVSIESELAEEILVAYNGELR